MKYSGATAFPYQVTPYRVGAGFRGATLELDQAVERAAQLMRERFGSAIEIRFNSDQKSGGAWLSIDAAKTKEACDIGISGTIYSVEDTRRTEQRVFGVERSEARVQEALKSMGLAPDSTGEMLLVYVYVSKRALKDSSLVNRGISTDSYLYLPQKSIEAAVEFVAANTVVGD